MPFFFFLTVHQCLRVTLDRTPTARDFAGDHRSMVDGSVPYISGDPSLLILTLSVPNPSSGTGLFQERFLGLFQVRS